MSARVNRVPGLMVAGGVLAVLLIASFLAPDFVESPDLSARYASPMAAPPFGNDERGIGLDQYAMQGAAIVTLPALVAGMLVALLATFGGLVRSAGWSRVDTGLQVVTELIGSLPRMVVILVVALLIPPDFKTLFPIALAWAVLASPGAIDEAAATAGRLGGERFVEALKAHGFSAGRIFVYHIIWLNLRPVIVRQAAEVAMQVVFLEIALSYMAVSENNPSFTHPDSTYSWATLLYQGYTVFLGQPLWHALGLGLVLVAMVAVMSTSLRIAARAR